MKLVAVLLRFLLCYASLCLLFGCTREVAQQAQPEIDLKDVLPKDEASIDVMLFGESSRMEELTKKLQQAVAKDADWWQAHVKMARPGEPLPYDARMGLTKVEYQEYLDLGKNVGLKKLKTVKVRVKQDGMRTILTFGEQLVGLKEAVIDLKNDSVTTPFGVASTRSVIKANASQRATGPWDGIQWELENVDLATAKGTEVKFAIGKLKKTGRGIIYYDVIQITEEARTAFHYVLLYDLKAPR